MQLALELGDEFSRCGEDEMCEGSLLIQAKREVRGAPWVDLGQRIGNIVGRLVTVPALIDSTGQLIEQLRAIQQLALLEHKHPGPLSVEDEHGEGRMIAENGLELTQVRRMVHR